MAYQLSPTSPFMHVGVLPNEPMAAQNNKIHFKCIALNFQAESQYTMTPGRIGRNFTMQQFHRKIHGPWWLLCHCVSAASCRQRLWPCDRYYSISHYTICSLHSALSLSVHLTLKQLFFKSWSSDVADSAHWRGNSISNARLYFIL